MTTITQADREALAAIDDALGFLTDPEREVDAMSDQPAIQEPIEEPKAGHLVTDECLCIVCRSDLLGIMPCVAKDRDDG